ncbi:MAG: FecR family protein, partial [Planctomycetota bacterium]
MKLEHEELLAHILGESPEAEAEAREQTISENDDAANEAAEIRAHLDLYEAVPAVAPSADCLRSIHERMRETGTAERPSWLNRYWPAAAAAALLVAALLTSQTSAPRPQRITHGSLVADNNGGYVADGVTRFAIGDGVIVTLDRDSTIRILSPQRLALQAGRLFLSVAKDRRGFEVETASARVTTTGTEFSVEAVAGATLVRVVEGEVLCTTWDDESSVGDGESRIFGENQSLRARIEETPRAWFTTPDITAERVAPDVIRLRFTNRMPDTIVVPAATGGEPLFFARHDGHDYPLAPESTHPLRTRPLTIEPGSDLTLTLRFPNPKPGLPSSGLPKSSTDQRTLSVFCRTWNVRVR